MSGDIRRRPGAAVAELTASRADGAREGGAGLSDREVSRPSQASETAEDPSRLTQAGYVVRSSGLLMLVFVVVGLSLTGVALWAGDRAAADDPTAHEECTGAGSEGKGIVALELAGDAEAARTIVEGWQPDNDGCRVLAGQALSADGHWFVPAYVAALAWWCLYSRWAGYRPSVRSFSGRLVVFVVVAGACDLVENNALAHVIDGEYERWAAVATGFSFAKWLLAALALPIALVGLVGAVRGLWGYMVDATPTFFGEREENDSGRPPLGPERPDQDDASYQAMRRAHRFLLPDSRTSGSGPDDPSHPHRAPREIGICLSGGGIRAASFALGGLQVLGERPLPDDDRTVYQRARYLATVSGGGYAGTAAQILAHQSPDTQPLAPRSTEEVWLRARRRYLWGSPSADPAPEQVTTEEAAESQRVVPGEQERSAAPLSWQHRWVVSTREFVTGIVPLVAGIAFNLLLVVTLLFAIAYPLGWLRAAVFVDGNVGTDPLADPELTVGQWIGVGMAACALTFLLRPRSTRERRRRLELIGRWSAAVAMAIAIVTTVVVVLRWRFHDAAFFVVPLVLAVTRAVVHVAWWWFAKRPTPSAAPGDPWSVAVLGKRIVTLVLAYVLIGVVLATGWRWVDRAARRGSSHELTLAYPFTALAVAAGLALAVLAGAALRLLLDRPRRGSVRECYCAAFGVGLAVLAVACLVTLVWPLGVSVDDPGGSLTIVVAIVVAIVLIFLAWQERRPASVVKHPTYLLAVGVLLAVAAGVAGALAAWRQAGSWRSTDVTTDAVGWSVVVGALVLTYVFGDQKLWSPHLFYKSRLAGTFALTKDRHGVVSALPYWTPTTLSSWAAKPAGAPQLLICAAAYDNESPRPGELPAWPFVFSSDYVGSADIGWVRTVDFEAMLGRRNLGDGTLESAMAISGAAVSPAIGQIDLGSGNSLVAAFNARLGVWLPNPRYIREMRAGVIQAAETREAVHRTTRVRDNVEVRRRRPPAPSWIQTRRFTYLLKEILGRYDPDSRLLYVTDGGQVDNLGLTELLARRCETIFCFDASGDLKPDKAPNTNTFDGVRELARRRLGVRFSVPGCKPDGSAPHEQETRKVEHGAVTPDLVRASALPAGPCTAGHAPAPPSGDGDDPLCPRVPVVHDNVTVLDVHYPGGRTGRLVYAKCVVASKPPDTDCPASPADDGPDAERVKRYARTIEGWGRFPADSTVDQWLDADQFDAYVALGRWVGNKAVDRLSMEMEGRP